MADPISSATDTAGPFDTAQMQIAMAKAQAAAANANETAFLQEIAKANDEANAHALDPQPVPANNNLPGADPFGEPVADPSAFLTEFGAEPASSEAQQLHDIALLEKDAAFLEEAEDKHSHAPLGSRATTVDLTPEAQNIVNVSSITDSETLTPTQLTQISDIIRPLGNAPLTPALLQQIQAQLAAAQNPIQLSLNTIARAMNFIAGMQTSPNHAVENAAIPNDNEVVTPVSAIDRGGVEDSAIR